MDGGCIICKGNICRSFRQPFGGEFYFTGALHINKLDFDSITGVEAGIMFCNYPTDNSTMDDIMSKIIGDPNFEFNMSQFDEFMEIFEFYKALCADFFDEDVEAADWNYDDYFAEKVKQAINEITNPLGA